MTSAKSRSAKETLKNVALKTDEVENTRDQRSFKFILHSFVDVTAQNKARVDSDIEKVFFFLFIEVVWFDEISTLTEKFALCALSVVSNRKQKP